jgi:hypothetical protein
MGNSLTQIGGEYSRTMLFSHVLKQCGVQKKEKPNTARVAKQKISKYFLLRLREGGKATRR